MSGTKVSMDGHTLAFQKNNLVDSMVITVDTDETWQYKLDVKYSCKDSKGEQLYNVIDLTRVGNTCTAILQASMLPFNGKYTMQLRGISDDKVYHTDTFDVWVKYSIDPGKVYDPVPSEFYQIESNITSMNNHPPKPGNNGYWLVWNVPKQEYEESDIPLPEGTLPEVSDSTNGWYLTNDGERVYWAEVQGGSGEGDITAIQVNGINQPIVDKVAKLTIGKDTVGLGNLDNVRQYSSVNQPPYPVTSVDGSTGDVATLSVKYTKQTLTVAQQQQARENIGAGTSNFDGAYDSLTGKPDIPSKTSELENDTGFITNAALAPYAKTADVPTKTSQLNNDSGFVDAAGASAVAPVQSVADKTGAVTLTKADVGLGNVDNTSDANKPISAATQTALNGKLDKTEVVDVTSDAIKGQAADAKSVYDVIQALPTGTDLSLGITGAQVGQIAKITAVDTDGKPIQWDPVDMPIGGGGETWELIAEIDFDVDVANDVFSWEYKNLPNYKELSYKKVGLVGSTETASGLSISINDGAYNYSSIQYAKKGSQSNGWGKILPLPFGWIHVNSGSATLPTNHSFSGLQAIYNAIPFDVDSITSVKMSSHQTYKIAGGKLSLYGRR